MPVLIRFKGLDFSESGRLYGTTVRRLRGGTYLSGRGWVRAEVIEYIVAARWAAYSWFVLGRDSETRAPGPQATSKFSKSNPVSLSNSTSTDTSRLTGTYILASRLLYRTSDFAVVVKISRTRSLEYILASFFRTDSCKASSFVPLV
jgi:hypothetical protein